MKYFLSSLIVAFLLGASPPQANAGAAVCAYYASSNSYMKTSVTEGPGYNAYNEIILEMPGGSSCWSSGNLEHGYLIVIRASEFIEEDSSGNMYIPYAAGFGSSRNDALRKAINALEREGVYGGWSENKGYVTDEERTF